MSAFEDETAESQSPGRLIVAVFFLLFGAGGLALLPAYTGTSPGDEGWFTQPWLMPAMTLTLLTGAALVHTLRMWRDRRTASTGRLVGELWMWLRAGEVFFWYVRYIWLLGVVGYGLSTFIFIAGLGVRVGLRQPRWILAALVVTIAMTLLFRLGLKIWVPAADLYEILPSGIRNFMQQFM